ncbi:GDSL-type esterase/lipase family protein [Pedococcus sp. 5OH_020]|uniref:GDSL-type esterase/lipase family protein n=1 Tax=Pedococcus sp. 5OH_020 TaxID=2989814 RepID=UPI0022E9F019|nr:GDSL-type esterase/lipase family protein [Pedococcus sp. 5OH_020]
MYAALGDSISIDDYAGGPGRGGASLLASNRDGDFPEWSGRDLRSTWPGMPLHLLATDGATSWTVLRDQIPRLESLRRAPSLVTLTAGGNDVLACFGDTRAALDAVRTVTARLATVLVALASIAADAVVVVGTVYDPSDGTADAARLGLPAWPDAVKVIAELNAELCHLAGSHGARIAHVHRRFLGHGLSAGDPARPDARPRSRDLWYCNVIEPNAWGASAVRAAFWEALHPGA